MVLIIVHNRQAHYFYEVTSNFGSTVFEYIFELYIYNVCVCVHVYNYRYFVKNFENDIDIK